MQHELSRVTAVRKLFLSLASLHQRVGWDVKEVASANVEGNRMPAPSATIYAAVIHSGTSVARCY